MLSCKEATRLESQAMERPLTRIESVQLRLHLWMCVGCRRAQQQFAFLRTACGTWRSGKE